VSEATVVMVLTPDAGQGKLFRESIESHLQPRSMLMFAHGFAIHFAQIKPDAQLDVAMIAPKGPGHLVRSTYVQGQGIPALIAVHQDATGKAWPRALAYARALGAGRAGVGRSVLSSGEGAGIRWDVDGVLVERGEGNDLERPFVRGGQHDVGGRAVLV